MKKLTAEELLISIVERLTQNLMEIEECTHQTEFIYGEKTAYVECLEWVQSWQFAEKYGLDYEVEKRFPL